MSEMLDPTYLPFTEERLSVHLAPVGTDKTNAHGVGRKQAAGPLEAMGSGSDMDCGITLAWGPVWQPVR